MGKLSLNSSNPRELNPQNLPTSDITAISQQNPNLNGELNINATDTEPTKDLTELPNVPIDAKMSELCKTHEDKTVDQFIYIGWGGIRPLPGKEPFGDLVLGVDWVELEGTKGDGEMGRWGNGGTRREGDGKMRKNRIVEASHWVVDENGDILFVAEQGNGSSDKFNEAVCKRSAG